MSRAIGKDGPIEPQVPAPVPKEPEGWETFHKRLFRQGQEALREYDKRKLSKELLTQDLLAKAHKSLHRGAMTREFLDGEFWNSFLKPALGDSQDVKPWEPGDSRTLEAVAVDHLFSSGKAALAKIILKKFEDWIRLGDEAKKAIAQNSERVDRIKDISRG